MDMTQETTPELKIINLVAELAATELIALRTRVEALTDLYMDLICEVVSKFPDETRHDTARRYIRERESRINGVDEQS